MKALTKTTNCTFRAKKVEGHDQKKVFRRFAPDRCPTPHFQIRSGAPDVRCVKPGKVAGVRENTWYVQTSVLHLKRKKY